LAKFGVDGAARERRRLRGEALQISVGGRRRRRMRRAARARSEEKRAADDAALDRLLRFGRAALRVKL
jgi:hypothetical protein